MYEEIILFGQEKGNIPFNLFMCGISHCDETYKINRPASPVTGIEYIYKGSGKVIVNGVEKAANEGDLFLLPEGKNHSYYCDADNPWIKIWMNVNGSFVDSAIEAYRLKDVYVFKNADVSKILEKIISDARVIKATNITNYNFDSFALDFLKLIQTISSTNQDTTHKSASIFSQILKNKLDSVTDFSLSFDELISDIYCTKSHLIRIFKNEYGITPYAYLLERKANSAKILLKNTALSIKEISLLLGFDDSHYFSNFFKKQTSISPYEFRHSKKL